MKGRQLFVIMMVCIGLGATGLLAGCGGANCQDMCNKAFTCGFIIGDCVNVCEGGDCDCDPGTDCVTFNQCVANCFANP